MMRVKVGWHGSGNGGGKTMWVVEEDTGDSKDGVIIP